MGLVSGSYVYICTRIAAVFCATSQCSVLYSIVDLPSVRYLANA